MSGLVSHAEEVMGTVVSLTLDPRDPSGRLLDAGAVDRMLAEACSVLHEADATFSTYKETSRISRMRRGELAFEEGGADVEEVIGLCAEARLASGGWFDAWSMPGGFDPTGLVKGWAAERALAAVERGGARAALVNAGGDLAGYGQHRPGEPWRIGIRHPWRPDALACVVDMGPRAVATSGNYERGAHLLDPFTGEPARGVASATVTGPSLAMADALATALGAGGEEVLARIERLPAYEAYLVLEDGRELASPGFPFAATSGGAKIGA